MAETSRPNLLLIQYHDFLILEVDACVVESMIMLLVIVVNDEEYCTWQFSFEHLLGGYYRVAIKTIEYLVKNRDIWVFEDCSNNGNFLLLATAEDCTPVTFFVEHGNEPVVFFVINTNFSQKTSYTFLYLRVRSLRAMTSRRVE